MHRPAPHRHLVPSDFDDDTDAYVTHGLAKPLGGKAIELGEVRETRTIHVRQWTAYESFEVCGNGWGGHDGLSTLAEIEEADADDPGWDERPDVEEP